MILGFVGDIALTGIISEDVLNNSKRYENVYPILQKYDCFFANLEVPVKTSKERNEFKNRILYSLPKSTKELLKSFHITAVSLANNHIYDCKMSGLKATINLLDELKIYHTGAGWLPEHIEPNVIEKNGVKIAFLAYVDTSTNPKTEKYPELFINYLDRDKIMSEVKLLRRSVDIIIVSLHWGIDYSFYPLPKQVDIAHDLIKSGVNIIMGHHPHTLQPYERYKQGHIFYSLGGLTFGDYQKYGKKQLQALFRKTKRGLIAIYDTNSNKFRFISTLEKKGNYIKIINRDYHYWSKHKWLLFRIKYSSKVMLIIFDFKEKVLDRIYEYFFGYYQNPLKRLFQVSNIKKIGRLFK